jgi:hypothetical protein
VIPFNKFTSQSNPVAVFKSFGGLCWFKDNNNTSKLQPRYREGRFINYVEGSESTFKVWDIESGKAKLSQDVVFSKRPDIPRPVQNGIQCVGVVSSEISQV